MTARAPYSPSTLPRLAICPGWLSDPTPGPAAERGTAIHAHLAAYVAGTLDLADVPAAQRWPVEWGCRVVDELRERFPDLEWSAEVPVDVGVPGCYGTADLVGLPAWTDEAVVLDWKTGRGEHEDAGESLQTAAYGVGVLRASPGVARVTTIIAECDQCEMTECGWEADALLAVAPTIENIIDAARDAGPGDYRPSPKACQYCLRRESCPALMRDVAAAVNRTPASLKTVALLRPDELGAALARYVGPATLVERYMGALKHRAHALLESGIAVPGWRLAERATRRDWTADAGTVAAEVAAWAAEREVSAPDITEVASPAEVERRLAATLGAKRGAKAEAARALARLCETKKATTLVRDADG